MLAHLLTLRSKVMAVSMFMQAISGLIADARRVVNQAQDEAASYRFTYSQPIPVKVCACPCVCGCMKKCISPLSLIFLLLPPPPPPPLQHLVDRVSGFMHVFTLYGSVRPFGSSIMFGAYNKDDGPQLFLADPSGVSWVGFCSG